MKKNFYYCAALSVALLLTGCNKQNPKMDEKPVTASEQPSEFKIAYVEVDSLMTQYQFSKDYTAILQKKGQNIENTLTQKGQELQNAVANFQQKLQQNAYTREQAEGIQANLQRKQQDLQNLQQRLSTEFANEQEKFNTALRDSLQHFLAAYNKDKKYTLIISKAGDNILFADKAYDITEQIITGLNKAYKPSKGKADAKKADAETAKDEKKK